MDSYKRLNFIADIAETMIRNGAETYRVEETIQFVLRKLTDNAGESFVSPTIIICTEICDGDIKTITRRIKGRGVNLNKVNLANDLSRRITSGQVSMEEAIVELEDINKSDNYSLLQSLATVFVCCGAFVFIFDGTYADTVAAGMIGVFLYAFREFLSRLQMSNFVSDILGGALVSVLALLAVDLGIGRNLNAIIISAIMLLVPGVTLANSFRDVLEGDYLSGMSRLLEAIFVAVCIAIGVGVVLRLGVL